jgi:radical SAM family uncharacterized protein/radical SAM-linked protein
VDDLLQRVERPSRYLGNEINSVHKDLSAVTIKVGLTYPDLYEIGMSNTGLNILYFLLNGIEHVAAERVYLPARDLEALLEQEGRPLTTLESKIPLRELDVLGVQIPHELAYANIVKTIRMGGIPVWAKDRGQDDPIVLGGGPGVFGAEPVAPFYDAMLLGDAEEELPAILETVRAARDEGVSRHELLQRLAAHTGVYVPLFYEVDYHEDGQIAAIRPIHGAPEVVHKAIVEDLEAAYYPDTAIVPFADTVHDRLGVEVMRGCTVGCRFCQAGMIYRPVRERSPRRILDLAKCGLNSTGFSDVSLLSLDTGDYTLIDPLTKDLLKETADKRVALSLPSLRAGSLTDDVIRDIQRVRKTSFTVAPEAGTQRLRDVINKNISDQEIYDTVERVAKAGWKGIKLYFMIGFPTERQDDLDGLVALVERCRQLARKHVQRFTVTASVGTLVPKPHTPFQWDPQLSQEESRRRIRYLEREFRVRRISFKYHQPVHSWMEGIFSRADRRLAPVIAEVEADGGGFESWSDQLDIEKWKAALAKHGVDPDWFLRQREYDEVLPWEHLSARVTKKFLLADRKKVDRMAEPVTFDCRDDLCAGCSACFTEDIRNRLAKYHPDPFHDGRRLPMALTSRIAMGHGVAQQVEKQEGVRDQAAKAGAQAAIAKLRRSRRPKNPGKRRWAVTPGAPGTPGPAPTFLEDGEAQASESTGEPVAPAAPDAPAALPDASAPGVERYVYRVTYTQLGDARWLSHREVMRCFYRLLTRAELPITFTEGYHPKPKVGFGMPLPVGVESLHEELDIYLNEPLEPQRVLTELERLMPLEQGLRPVAARRWEGKAVQAERFGGRWTVLLDSLPGCVPAQVPAAVEAFLAAESVPITITRHKKPPRDEDLKLLVRDLRLSDDGERLEFGLIRDNKPSAKPSVVAASVLGLDAQRCREGRYTLVGVLERDEEPASSAS